MVEALEYIAAVYPHGNPHSVEAALVDVVNVASKALADKPASDAVKVPRELLDRRAQSAEPVQGEAVAGWRRSDRPYEMTAYPSVCATWHRHGFPVQALYTSPAKPDAELVELLRQCLDAMRTPYSDTRLMARIDAKLAEVNKP
jgi:hypothetical protein